MFAFLEIQLAIFSWQIILLGTSGKQGNKTTREAHRQDVVAEKKYILVRNGNIKFVLEILPLTKKVKKISG